MSEATRVETRERLLWAAAAEFASKGLDGARIDDISVAAGLAKGTIYNYFDSKLDVFKAVITEWAQRTDAARMPVPEDAPVRDQLLAIVNADAKVVSEMEEFARTAMREVMAGPSDALASVLPAFDPIDAELRRIVQRGQKSGELRSDRTAGQLALLFNTLINGLLLEHWIPGSGVELADIPEMAVDYYLDGVRTRET